MVNFNIFTLNMHTQSLDDDSDVIITGSSCNSGDNNSSNNNSNGNGDNGEKNTPGYVKVEIKDPFNNRDIILKTTNKQKGVYV